MRRRRKSSGPPSMRCRCVRNASIFDPRVAAVGDFGAWTLSAARPQPRRDGGGLSPERFGSAAEKKIRRQIRSAREKSKAEVALWWSPSIETCRRRFAVLLWCWSWIFAGQGQVAEFGFEALGVWHRIQCVASQAEEGLRRSCILAFDTHFDVSCGSSAVTRHLKQPCKAQKLDHLNVCALALNPQAPSKSVTSNP